MKTTILLTIEHDSPIPDLTDLIAVRAYTVLKENTAGVVDVTAKLEE
jgi:hypothetical protein